MLIKPTFDFTFEKPKSDIDFDFDFKVLGSSNLVFRKWILVSVDCHRNDYIASVESTELNMYFRWVTTEIVTLFWW